MAPEVQAGAVSVGRIVSELVFNLSGSNRLAAQTAGRAVSVTRQYCFRDNCDRKPMGQHQLRGALAQLLEFTLGNRHVVFLVVGDEQLGLCLSYSRLAQGFSTSARALAIPGMPKGLIKGWPGWH
jgi:hypothetical protein